MTISKSTISGNTAGGVGGGIWNGSIGTSSPVTIINSTISGNTASSGGGIFRAGGPVTITNSIIANSPSDDCSGSITSNGHNLDSDGTCIVDGVNDDITADPVLGPLQSNGGPTITHALLSGSPAIDAGDDSAAPATDQRGFPRPHEFGAVPPSPTPPGGGGGGGGAPPLTPTPTPIPGLSGPGLLAMASLILAAFLWAVRRHGRQVGM